MHTLTHETARKCVCGSRTCKHRFSRVKLISIAFFLFLFIERTPHNMISIVSQLEQLTWIRTKKKLDWIGQVLKFNPLKVTANDNCVYKKKSKYLHIVWTRNILMAQPLSSLFFLSFTHGTKQKYVSTLHGYNDISKSRVLDFSWFGPVLRVPILTALFRMSQSDTRDKIQWEFSN